jgi:hypothetical protein
MSEDSSKKPTVASFIGGVILLAILVFLWPVFYFVGMMLFGIAWALWKLQVG